MRRVSVCEAPRVVVDPQTLRWEQFVAQVGSCRGCRELGVRSREQGVGSREEAASGRCSRVVEGMQEWVFGLAACMPGKTGFTEDMYGSLGGMCFCVVSVCVSVAVCMCACVCACFVYVCLFASAFVYMCVRAYEGFVFYTCIYTYVCPLMSGGMCMSAYVLRRTLHV